MYLVKFFLEFPREFLQEFFRDESRKKNHVKTCWILEINFGRIHGAISEKILREMYGEIHGGVF